MSQQQIKTYDQNSLYQKYSKSLSKEADNNFANKHFKIKGYNRENFLKSYLMTEILCEDNCEIQNFISKKLRGALGDENIVIGELKTIQTKYADVNNYYITNNQGLNFEKADW